MQVRPSESAGAIDLGVFSQRAAQHGDGIVATVAVAREGDAARRVANQQVHAGAVKRRAEGVGMQSLPPLCVSLLMAGSAILGAGKCAGLKKALALHLDVSRRERLVFAVVKIVCRRLTSALYALRAASKSWSALASSFSRSLALGRRVLDRRRARSGAVYAGGGVWAGALECCPGDGLRRALCANEGANQIPANARPAKAMNAPERSYSYNLQPAQLQRNFLQSQCPLPTKKFSKESLR
jgi:hypothetical protein